MSAESTAGPGVYTSIAATREFVPLGDGAISWLRQDDDVRAGTCVYKLAEAGGRHPIDFGVSETLLVLEGRIRLEMSGGPTVELGPGESASFEQGARGDWSLVEDTKLFFVST